MRILFVNTYYPPDIGGGAELTLRSIASGLSARGVDAWVLTTTGVRQTLRERRDGVNCIRVPLKNFYWPLGTEGHTTALRALWHLRDSFNPTMGRIVGNAIEELEPDVLACHNVSGFSCAAWTAASKANTPILQVLHDYYGICPKVTMYRNHENCERQCRDCAVLRLRLKRASHAVAAVVGVSQWVLDTHLSHGLFAATRSRSVIYNASTLPSPPAPNAKASDVLTFGFIGTLSRVKGLELLLDAFAKAAARSHRTVRLLVAGGGESSYVASLVRRCEGQPIEFTGRTDPAAFFPRLDVSVVPSLWHEPLGRVVFESMHFGVPVIGARRGGIPEMIQHGVNGLLFDPSSVDDLVTAMLRVSESRTELASMSASARESVKTFLDEARMLDEYEALFTSVANSRSLGTIPG